MKHIMKYNLYLNDLRLVEIYKESEKKMFFVLEDNTKIKRTQINNIKCECTKCQKKTILNVLPENYCLIKDEYLCSSCRNTGELNPQYNKRWSDEKKQQKSIKSSGINNPMFGKTFYDTWVEKYGKDIADEKLYEQSIKCSRSGQNNGMFNKTFYSTWVEKYGQIKADILLLEFRNGKSEWIKNHPEQLELMCLNAHLNRYKKTSIERTIENYLIDNNIVHKYNFICNRKYQYDFLLKDKKIVIEVQGDYWHANPNIYSDDDFTKKKLTEQQKYKIDLDIIKNEYIKQNTDYDIIYLWETEIKNKKYLEILKHHGIN